MSGGLKNKSRVCCLFTKPWCAILEFLEPKDYYGVDNEWELVYYKSRVCGLFTKPWCAILEFLERQADSMVDNEWGPNILNI